MSTLIPPQFDTYGRTFWIPSQVEPTVALIGTSLPAIRQSLASAAQRMSKVWSQFSFTSASHTRPSSGAGESAVRWTPQRLDDSELNMMSGSNESEVALHSGHIKSSDGATV